jgi:hypothetical protein
MIVSRGTRSKQQTANGSGDWSYQDSINIEEYTSSSGRDRHFQCSSTSSAPAHPRNRIFQIAGVLYIVHERVAVRAQRQHQHNNRTILHTFTGVIRNNHCSLDVPAPVRKFADVCDFIHCSPASRSNERESGKNNR